MHERNRRPGRGDVSGGGEFTDWDNPEDEEGAPEGYYDDEEEDDGTYVPGPGDPDYDLSEAAGYRDWKTPPRESIIPRWLIVAISILLILAILLPALLQAR